MAQRIVSQRRMSKSRGGATPGPGDMEQGSPQAGEGEATGNNQTKNLLT
jgi:hypothetical protein